MTIADALRSSGIPAAESEILLSAILNCDRTWVFAHGTEEISPTTLDAFEKVIKRRKNGEPVAYITGKKEFYGRNFTVNRSTLIPRPATELLTEQALKILKGDMIEPIREIDTQIIAWAELKEGAADVKLVVDVGTGSGCIAITIACERPDLRVIATDSSREALNTARENAVLHTVADRIEYREGSGFDCLHTISEPFLLISNPPYIPAAYELEKDVSDFEPHTALFAGEKGTDVLSPLIHAARNNNHCRGFIVECREEQSIDGYN